MTTRTVYVPRLIESAEQAEALPLSTIATSPVVDAAAVRVGYGHGWTMSGEETTEPHSHVVGWAALVPIEAEEETQGITTWPRPDNAPWPKRSDLCGNSDGEYYYRDDDGAARDITEEMTAWLAAQPVRTRLVTPWEEA